METPYISKIFKHINIFKEISNFLLDFTPMFSKIWFTFLALSIKLNIFVPSNQRIIAALKFTITYEIHKNM